MARQEHLFDEYFEAKKEKLKSKAFQRNKNKPYFSLYMTYYFVPLYENKIKAFTLCTTALNILIIALKIMDKSIPRFLLFLTAEDGTFNSLIMLLVMEIECLLLMLLALVYYFKE